jgi:hypothetical protein
MSNMLTLKIWPFSLSALIVCLAVPGEPARAQAVVKITPLGSHAGELCLDDRALLFEDPTGVRILYDPGFTTDETDPRLGDVHVILLSHAHIDHIGGNRPSRGGTCAAPGRGAANTNSNVLAWRVKPPCPCRHRARRRSAQARPARSRAAARQHPCASWASRRCIRTASPRR